MLVCCPFLLNAQNMAIGGYVTPAYGNIVYKSDFYDPVLTIGGGLNFNYYCKRWIFTTGLNLKNVGGSKEIPVTTSAQPHGTGDYTNLLRSIQILTVPVGVSYSVIKKENFKLYLGFNIENGKIISDVLKSDISNTSQKGSFDNNRKYYLGIMPKTGIECNISPKTFLFLNMGYTFQFYGFYETYGPMAPRQYKINNLFLDIGFGYRLGN